MKRERILITVKTYPTLSEKYHELVCTAGVREDGSWVRIYPMPFRKLNRDLQYSKYQWIELDLEPNSADFRPESFKPRNLHNAVLGESIGTGKDHLWLERKAIVLKQTHFDLGKLIEDAKNPKIRTSLATFKPKEILDLKVKKVSADELAKYDRRVRGLMEKSQQLELFEGKVDPFTIVEKVPYEFSYQLRDSQGRESTMMIEDWEINQLYRNCLAHHGGDEKKACEDVRKRYFDDFVKTKDLHLFLGTTLAHHNVARNPFIIIGTFHPKPETQGRLF